MKINSIKSGPVGPISEFQIDNLGDIVIIAGANGSGKTILKNSIKEAFQNNQSPHLEIEIEVKRKEEKKHFNNGAITLGNELNNQFQAYSNTRTRGGTFTGFVINIDSDRTIENVKFSSIGFYIPNPDDDEIPSNFYLSTFRDRWNNTVNKIYQMVASRERTISKFIVDQQDPDKSQKEILKRFPDRFLQFKKIFAQLLPDKELQAIDPGSPSEFHYKISGQDQPLPFNTLSSGEHEVVKICFDFLLKSISHCVVLFDEPELHLHPSLTFRLIETMKTMGKENQFFFFTHSADLITTYYNSGNVYFIDNSKKNGNQACKLKEINDNHSSIAQFISRDLGVFAVAKNIIFVEGKDSSIDKLTYHKVAETIFPNFVISPIGGVSSLKILNTLSQELTQTIFGINFFMIRDRDGLTNPKVIELTTISAGRFSALKRRHLENYYLNETILAEIAKRFCLHTKWHSPANLLVKMREIAKKCINLAIINEVKNNLQLQGGLGLKNPDNLERKGIDRLIQDFTAISNQEKTRIIQVLDDTAIEAKIRRLKTKYDQVFARNDDAVWKVDFPGKNIFAKVCADIFKMDTLQVRQAYIEAIIGKRKDGQRTSMDQVFKIFTDFKRIADRN